MFKNQLQGYAKHLSNKLGYLHYLSAVLDHYQVNMRLVRQKIPQQAQRLHQNTNLVIGQEPEDLVRAQR